MSRIERELSAAKEKFMAHKFDLPQGYFQVALDYQRKRFTGFTTNSGQYQMTRITMALKICPSAFSRVRTVAMLGLNYDPCFIT